MAKLALACAFGVVAAACQGGPFTSEAAATGPALTEQDVVRFVEEFNLWSDHDVHSRPEYRSRLMGSNVGPWLYEAVELTDMFHPRCSVLVTRQVETLHTIEDYVWLLGGRRFMFGGEECVIEGPIHTLARGHADVSMTKVQLSRSSSRDVYIASDFELRIERFGDRLAVTEMRLIERTPTDAETDRWEAVRHLEPHSTRKGDLFEQWERQREERLSRWAGVPGVDSEGRQLDRREFFETRFALNEVHEHMKDSYGSGRYPEALAESLELSSLLDPSEVHLVVSSDAKAWYAWRRTITGWCFAIGGSGPTRDRWTYDGPEPPSGFPGTDPCWGALPFPSEVSANW